MRTGAVAAALCALGLMPGLASAQASCTPRSAPVPVGLQLVGQKPIDARTTLYTFRSAAVGPDATPDGLVRARVILPKAYDASPDAHWPLVLNLHGTGGNAQGHEPARWQEVLGGAPVIWVEPDGGAKGFYSDWWGASGAGQPPGWETFHLRELLPWLERRLPTTGRRAISGGSMGGFGAMGYAARNPGLFQAAAAASGVLDTELLDPVGPWAISALYDPCIWGDPIAQRNVWQAHNPTRLAGRLRGTALFVAVGNGLPGRHDTRLPDPQAPVLEAVMNLMTQNFVRAAKAAGVPVTAWFYGNGTHPWTGYDSLKYDYDDVRRFLPIALAATGGAEQRPLTIRGLRLSRTRLTFRTTNATAATVVLDQLSRRGRRVRRLARMAADPRPRTTFRFSKGLRRRLAGRRVRATVTVGNGRRKLTRRATLAAR